MSSTTRHPGGPGDTELFGEVLFEFAALGNFVKVSAIDPVTNIEVCIVGSPAMSPYFLKKMAMQKLGRAIAGKPEPAGPMPTRRGLWA